MKIFYTFAFILGLTTIWMSKWEAPRTELASKAIASVLFLFFFIGVMIAFGRYKAKKRQEQIKGAVLIRRRPASTDEPAKD